MVRLAWNGQTTLLLSSVRSGGAIVWLLLQSDSGGLLCGLSLEKKNYSVLSIQVFFLLSSDYVFHVEFVMFLFVLPTKFTHHNNTILMTRTPYTHTTSRSDPRIGRRSENTARTCTRTPQPTRPEDRSPVWEHKHAHLSLPLRAIKARF